MKTSTSSLPRHAFGAAPEFQPAELQHLDGQCFLGDHGTLAVALRLHTLATLRRKSAPTHWLVPVENFALVAEASDLPGEVLWLCRRHPSTIVGHLEEDLRGAWLEDDAVVVNLDGQPIRLALAGPLATPDALAYLARLVANLWIGATLPLPLLKHISYFNLNAQPSSQPIAA